jgi:hypothetical protein
MDVIRAVLEQELEALEAHADTYPIWAQARAEEIREFLGKQSVVKEEEGQNETVPDPVPHFDFCGCVCHGADD